MDYGNTETPSVLLRFLSATLSRLTFPGEVVVKKQQQCCQYLVGATHVSRVIQLMLLIGNVLACHCEMVPVISLQSTGCLPGVETNNKNMSKMSTKAFMQRVSDFDTSLWWRWWWWLFPRVRGFWENVRQFSPRLLFFFFKVEISLRTLIPLFRPGSVHSGSAS